MFNLKITCEHPWLWLLLIPAVAITLFFYFRISKKYRRTRNRIISVVMHLIVTFMCVAVLANITLKYEVYNSQNEIILVVDSSYSTEQEKRTKDDFVKDVVMMTDPHVFKIGIVSFGYDYRLVSGLSNDVSAVIEAYETATEQPDSEATNIASAVEYAASLFTNKQSAKILLVSDGMETDDSVMVAVRNAVSEGIQVDTVCLSPNDGKDDVFSLVSCETPDYNVTENELFTLKLTVTNSSDETVSAKIALYDNDSFVSETSMEIKSGVQVVEIPHSLTGEGLHTFNFRLTADANDSALQNNSLYSYMLLNKYNKILIIDGFVDESVKLKELLTDYEVKTLYIGSPDMPETLDELRQYDEIILNNVSNADLQKHEGLDELLDAYVYEIGGGLFTVGGNEKTTDSDGNPIAHAYNRDDMENSLLSQMLPVQIIDYTPPLGVYIVVDVSGSMEQKLEKAKNAAKTVIDDRSCLSDRDYCGIMTLADDADSLTAKPLSVSAQRSRLINAVDDIDGTGSTNFSPAIEYAADNLLSLNKNGVVEKMHIIIITDAIAGDTETAIADIENYYAKGVTFSYLLIENRSPSEQGWDGLVNEGKLNWRVISNGNSAFTDTLKEDLRVPEIKEAEQKEFTPKVVTTSSYASILGDSALPVLKGFYGAKAYDDTTVLYGDYNVPVYAEWKYGLGTVGSFMSDLNGNWSADFLKDDAGKKFLLTAINKVFPTTDIRPQEITVSLREDNFTENITVRTTTELKDGEKITLSSDVIETEDFSVTQPSEVNGYARASIFTRASGVYEITVKKVDANGNELASKTFYRVFSYSEEFAYNDDTTKGAKLMAQIAQAASGKAQNEDEASLDASLAFEGFITSIEKSFDPRWLFMITAIVCFLIDIAVRKFKFKWIHEIIRDRKGKKQAKQGKTN